ncbi:Uncharacterised protein [Kurthia zopfii]|nr:Uncharacterised protein [Kurthia zopfii]
MNEIENPISFTPTFDTEPEWFYYICWGLKTIHVVTFRNNECFPPTSAALFLSTLGGKKGLLHTCFSAGVLVISFNVDLCEKRQKKAQFHQFLYT